MLKFPVSSHFYEIFFLQNTIMSELKTRVEELKMENEYQLRLKDMNYNEKIKELTEKFIQEMESLKTKNQMLKTDKDKEAAKHEEEVRRVFMGKALVFLLGGRGFDSPVCYCAPRRKLSS